MKLTVPFLYEALIIKPRCRKPSLITVSDTVEVEIQEVSAGDMPVAMRIGKTELLWDGEQLWDFDYECVAGEKPHKVLLTEVVDNTSGRSEYPWSCSGALAPFHNFWHGFRDSMANRHNLSGYFPSGFLKDVDYQSRDEVVCREWVDDNRESLIALAHQKAANLMAVDGYMFRPVGEPRYVVNTFGLGNNHGGTGMFIEQGYNSNLSHRSYFSALDYDKACAYADAVAERRGDTKSIPVRPNSGVVIEVLIPEAVRVDPARQHGDGCEFINDIEAGINAGGPMVGMAVAFAGIAH